MIPDRDEDGVAIPEKTTRLLSSHYGNASTRASSDPLDRRSRLWQRNAILLILAYFLLQMQRSFLTGSFLARQKQAMCYAYYREHPSIIIVPAGDLLRNPCLLYDPIRSGLTRLLDWDRISSVIPIFLAAVPYSRLVVYHGKKHLIILALIGLILEPLWEVFIGSPHEVDMGHVWLTRSFWMSYSAHFVSSYMIHLLAWLGTMHQEQGNQLYYLHGVYIITVIVAVPDLLFFNEGFSEYRGAVLSIACLLGCLIIMAFVDEPIICDTPQKSDDTETKMIQMEV